MKLAQPLAKVLVVVFLSAFCSNIFHKGPAESRGPALEGLLGSHVCQAMETEGLDIADGVEGQNATGRQVVSGWNAWKAGRHEALDRSALVRVHSQFAHRLSLGKSIQEVAREWVEKMQLYVVWNRRRYDWSCIVQSVHGS